MRNLLLGCIAASGLALTACETTAGSTGSTFSGLVSNFQETHKSFDTTFYDTLDMQVIAEGHYEFEDEDIKRLALATDPKTARGFLGVAHSSMYKQQGQTPNLVEKDHVTKPLESIKDRLLASWNGPAPEIKILVSGESGFHGRAYPENFIVIPIGAVIDIVTDADGAAAGTEDELAAFIAHEIAHILLGHYKRGEDATLRDRMNAAAGSMTLVGAALGGLRADKVGDEYKITLHNEERTSDLMKKTLIASSILSETNSLLAASAGREQEDHADLLAYDLMSLAGYDPNKLSTFLDRSEVHAKDKAASIENLSAQQSVIASTLASSLGAGQGNFLSDMLAAGAVKIFSDIVSDASATHRSIAKRKQNVTGYQSRLQAKFFDETLPEEQKTESLDAIVSRSLNGTAENVQALALQQLRSGEAQKLLKAYQDAFEAKQLIANGDEESLSKARELVISSRNGVGSDEAEILTVSASYHTAIQQHAAAVRDLEAAVKLDGASPMIFGDLAGTYLAVRNSEKALEAIEAGERETGTRMPFLFLRISYFAAQNLIEEAIQTNEECKATKVDGIIAKCAEAMAPVEQILAARREAAKANQSQQPSLGDIFGIGSR